MLLLFTALSAIVALIANGLTHSSEHYPPWLQTFSEKERDFVLHANQLSIRVHEGHMDRDDVLETYQTHKMWLAEYEREIKDKEQKRNFLQ